MNEHFSSDTGNFQKLNKYRIRKDAIIIFLISFTLLCTIFIGLYFILISSDYNNFKFEETITQGVITLLLSGALICSISMTLGILVTRFLSGTYWFSLEDIHESERSRRLESN